LQLQPTDLPDPNPKRLQLSGFFSFIKAPMDALRRLTATSNPKQPSQLPDDAPTLPSPINSPEITLPGQFPSEPVRSQPKERKNLFRTPTRTHAPLPQPSRSQPHVHVRQLSSKYNRTETDQWNAISREINLGPLTPFTKDGHYSAPPKRSYLRPVLNTPRQQVRPPSGAYRGSQRFTSLSESLYGPESAKHRAHPQRNDGLSSESQRVDEEPQSDILKNMMREVLRELPKSHNNQVNGHISPAESPNSVWTLMRECVQNARDKRKSVNNTKKESSINSLLPDGLRQSQKLERRKEELQEEEAEEETLNVAFKKFSIEYKKWDHDRKEIERKEKERQKEKLKEQKKPPEVKPPEKKFIREPSKEAFTKVPSLEMLRENPGHEVIKGRNPISHDDLLKILLRLAWLNDNAVNGFLAGLCESAKAKLSEQRQEAGKPIDDIIPRFHSFNTFWYPKMTSKKGYDDVKMWAKRAKFPGATLLKLHKLFIPIHLVNHWLLLVINPQKKSLTVYDSMTNKTTTRSILSAGRDYLRNELGDAWKEDEWKDIDGKSSQQVNGSDCGVFTCFNALATFYGKPNELIPEALDLVDPRKMMAAILVNGGFSGEFDLEEFYPGFTVEIV
jgi:sentrin-specific protease 1